MDTVNRRLPAVLAGITAIAAGAGLLDAVFTDEYDFAVVFALVAACGTAQALVLARRPGIELRRDVVRWLTERSQLTGEPVDRLADRAVTTYRASLSEGNDVPASGGGT